MVLLAAAVCTKAGKVLVARQFVDMTRSRVEGLLSAFPKLITSGKQHTFVETESVRYVYQTIEKLFVVLITTKNSNILEDLETLRLFARVIPEYSHSVDEMGITENAFQLIFAFDEIVALGYRESVNIQQIRTFIEMDSHEEKVYNAVRSTQESEAKEAMKKKIKDMERNKRNDDRSRSSKNSHGFSGSAYDSISPNVVPISSPDATPVDKPKYAPSRTSAVSGKAMKLGAKNKDVDTFVDQLVNEGEVIKSDSGLADRNRPREAAVVPPSKVLIENVHLKIEEKLNVSIMKDGGVESFQLQGMMTAKVFDERFNRVSIHLKNALRGAQVQPHPNIDKQLFNSSHVVALKNPDKPFPVNTDIGVLKWRMQSTDDSIVPLTINCWPNDTGNNCEVNVEYELANTNLELREVQIGIPIPSNAGAPVVSEVDGNHQFESRRSCLYWRLELIDSSNSTGTLVFTTGSANPDQFFPINVTFYSQKTMTDLTIDKVVDQNGSSLKFSTDASLVVEKYEVV
jgi:hypothetical protein